MTMRLVRQHSHGVAARQVLAEVVFFVVLLAAAAAGGARAQGVPDSTADAVYGQLGDFSTQVDNKGGRSADSLSTPVGMAVDASGNLFVTEAGSNRRVSMFPRGSTTATKVWGRTNMTDFSTDSPFFLGLRDVAVDDAGGLYVTDFNRDRVLYFPPGITDGTNFSRQYGPVLCNGTCRNLDGPVGVSLDPGGAGVYITDWTNRRVLFFPGTNATHPSRVYGQLGDFTMRINNNGGVSADSLSSCYGVDATDDGVYISDTFNHRVLYFPGNSTTASRVYGQLGNFSTNLANAGGVSARSLNSPRQISVDGAGGLYVTDRYNHRVLFFGPGSTTAGSVFGQFGNYSRNLPNSGGVSADSLTDPQGVVFDSACGLYVSSSLADRALLYLSVAVNTNVTTGSAVSNASTSTASATTSATAANSSSSSSTSSTSPSATTGSVPLTTGLGATSGGNSVPPTTAGSVESTQVVSGVILGLSLPIVLAIAGCASCVVILVVVATAIAIRRRDTGIDWTDYEASHFEVSEEELDLSFTKYPQGKPLEKAKEATEYANLLRGVEIQKQIGEGNFGKVFLGEYKGMPVAVKQIVGGDSEDEFMKELDVMLDLNSPRIIGLFGVCLLRDHGGSMALVMEFAAKGELCEHLRRADHSQLSEAILLQISLHIAEGLTYLHGLGILHRDLAARNVLVVNDGSCKLADFGMARRVGKDEEYVTNAAFPIRWTAPESLEFKKVTQSSDCYSLAITMWEVFSLGQVPFGNMPNGLVGLAVIDEGARPPQPERCSDEIFNVIKLLWNQFPANRMTASDAVIELTALSRGESKSPNQEPAYASIFAAMDLAPQQSMYQDTN